MKPEFSYDERTLREVPKDLEHLRAYIQELRDALPRAIDPKNKVSILGEIGTLLRSAGELFLAEQSLEEALSLVQSHSLGLQWEIQQKIRLAHVFQWQGRFDRSNGLFSEVMEICRRDGQVKNYLPFALQHSGKNFFDQGLWREALALFEEALALRMAQGAAQDQIESSQLALKETKRRLNIRE
ncbi:Tetratricopeptide repeat protein [compost metagenome]